MTFPIAEGDIRKAYELILPYIRRTPLLTCRSLDEETGCRIFFKAENFQKTGSFKVTKEIFEDAPYTLTF